MKKQELTITPALIQKYAAYLRDQERSAATIEKYVHDLNTLSAFLAGRAVAKGLFVTNALITREQFAVILHRFCVEYVTW